MIRHKECLVVGESEGLKTCNKAREVKRLVIYERVIARARDEKILPKKVVLFLMIRRLVRRNGRFA